MIKENKKNLIASAMNSSERTSNESRENSICVGAKGTPEKKYPVSGWLFLSETRNRECKKLRVSIVDSETRFSQAKALFPGIRLRARLCKQSQSVIIAAIRARDKSSRYRVPDDARPRAFTEHARAVIVHTYVFVGLVEFKARFSAVQ